MVDRCGAERKERIQLPVGTFQVFGVSASVPSGCGAAGRLWGGLEVRQPPSPCRRRCRCRRHNARETFHTTLRTEKMSVDEGGIRGRWTNRRRYCSQGYVNEQRLREQLRLRLCDTYKIHDTRLQKSPCDSSRWKSWLMGSSSMRVQP